MSQPLTWEVGKKLLSAHTDISISKADNIVDIEVVVEGIFGLGSCHFHLTFVQRGEMVRSALSH